MQFKRIDERGKCIPFSFFSFLYKEVDLVGGGYVVNKA